MKFGPENQTENLVYNAKTAPLLGERFNHFHAFLVSYDPSRKSFLGKLIGLAAVAGIAPGLLAKNSVVSPSPVTTTPRPVVRPDARAVARREPVI